MKVQSINTSTTKNPQIMYQVSFGAIKPRLPKTISTVPHLVSDGMRCIIKPIICLAKFPLIVADMLFAWPALDTLGCILGGMQKIGESVCKHEHPKLRKQWTKIVKALDNTAEACADWGAGLGKF